MAIVIGKAVGDKNRRGKADNLSADVKKIQELLKKLRVVPHIMVNGKCDDKLLKAIAEFQGMFRGGIVDSRVDPNRTTLKRLNTLADPLVLQAISLESIREGGYKIRYDTSTKEDVPTSKYKVFLGLASQGQQHLSCEPLPLFRLGASPKYERK